MNWVSFLIYIWKKVELLKYLPNDIIKNKYNNILYIEV